MHTIDAVVALILVATVVAMATRRLRLPYTIALVVVGIGMHEVGAVPPLHLTQELLMTVLLPALLFEAAIHVQARELRQVSTAVVTLAIPGVLLAMSATGLVLFTEVRAIGEGEALPWQLALLFGALIAATDPISVVSLFKQLGVSRRLGVLVEGESLLNDGTGVVVFGIVLAMALGQPTSAGGAIWQFVLVFAGGAIIGAAIGLLASWATAQVDDHLIEIALTTVTAWGAFLIAERIHVSGVIATVVAGLMVGNIGKTRGMSPTSREAVLSFWEYAAFFINSIVFLLLGLEVSLGAMWEHKAAIGLAFVAVLVGRAVAVYAPLPLLRRLGQSLDGRSATVLFWGGLRGSLSMVLAMSLPRDLPGRELIVTMTFGVVVLSILVQGSTMGLVLRRLGLVRSRSEAVRWLDLRLARLRVLRAQLQAVQIIDDDHGEPDMILQPVHARLENERAALVQEMETRLADVTQTEMAGAVATRREEIDAHLLEVARDALRELTADGLLDEHMAAQLGSELLQARDQSLDIPAPAVPPTPER
ncbi:MAG: sodium:proton antiporter [Pseudomonadota bacterium]